MRQWHVRIKNDPLLLIAPDGVSLTDVFKAARYDSREDALRASHDFDSHCRAGHYSYLIEPVPLPPTLWVRLQIDLGF